MKNILDEIVRLRLKRGWTEYELAKQSGIPQSTISTWYRRNQVPTLDNLNKVCEGLGITLSSLFAGEGDAIVLTPEEKELLDHWAALSPKQQEIIRELLGHMGKE